MPQSAVRFSEVTCPARMGCMDGVQGGKVVREASIAVSTECRGKRLGRPISGLRPTGLYATASNCARRCTVQRGPKCKWAR